ADAEETSVNQNAAHDPIEGIAAEVLNGRQFWRHPSHRAPAIDAGMDAAIEGKQLGIRFGGSQESGEHPGDGGASGSDERGLGEDNRFAAGKGNFGKRKGDDAGDTHSYDFAPGIHPPPIPAQNVHRSGAAADSKHDLPSLQNGSELSSDVSGENHQSDRKK